MSKQLKSPPPSARDEFARDLFLADNSSFPPGVAEADWDTNREHHDYAYAIVDGLIAKGYRKTKGYEGLSAIVDLGSDDPTDDFRKVRK